MASYVDERIYQSFGGVNMKCHIGSKEVGSLNGLAVSITREAAPVFTMGHPSFRSIVRGKRAIVGSMSFATFDRHTLLYDIFAEGNNGMQTLYSGTTGRLDMARASLQSRMQAINNNDQASLIDAYTDVSKFKVEGVAGGYIASRWQDMFNTARQPKYIDELPPFNLTMTMVNDEGACSYFNIYGIYLLNEAFSYTLDDLTNDINVTYMARDIDPLQSAQNILYPTSSTTTG